MSSRSAIGFSFSPPRAVVAVRDLIARFEKFHDTASAGLLTLGLLPFAALMMPRSRLSEVLCYNYGFYIEWGIRCFEYNGNVNEVSNAAV